MTSSVRHLFIGTLLVLGLAGCATTRADREACLTLAEKGFRPIAGERAERFLGKVQEYTARCRGGDKAVAFRAMGTELGELLLSERQMPLHIAGRLTIDDWSGGRVPCLHIEDAARVS